MPADFLDAHARHWDDAEYLYADARWANADHLYGFAAECGLKRLMIAFGMRLHADGTGRPHEFDDRKHANIVWDRYEMYRSGQASSYALPATNPFDEWRAEQRYDAKNQITPTTAKAHRQGVLVVSALLERAINEGIL